MSTPGATPFPWLSLALLAGATVLCFALARLLFEWDARAVTPSRRAWFALLGIVPFAIAMAVGG
jgi:hypothetical protein